MLFGVIHHPQASRSKPHKAQVRRGGKMVHLGIFATAEEAALYIARSPEGQEAANRPAAAAPSEEARQQAEAEGGADAARGRQHDGLLRRVPQHLVELRPVK